MYELSIVKVGRNDALIYIVFFVFVGAMMVLLPPLLAEKAEALTRAGVYSTQMVLSHHRYHMDNGVFVIAPHFLGTPHWGMTWLSRGSGPFGGTEFGHVTVDLTSKQFNPSRADATMSWYNPLKGKNECGIVIGGRDAKNFEGFCHITQGDPATASFNIHLRPIWS